MEAKGTITTVSVSTGQQGAVLVVNYAISNTIVLEIP